MTCQTLSFITRSSIRRPNSCTSLIRNWSQSLPHKCRARRNATNSESESHAQIFNSISFSPPRMLKREKFDITRVARVISNFSHFNILRGEKEIVIDVRMRFGFRIGCISLSSALMGQLLRPTRKYGVRSPYTTSWFIIITFFMSHFFTNARVP